MRRVVVFAAFVLFGISSTTAQEGDKRQATVQNLESKAPLALRLEPGELIHGLPQTFTFVFLNVTKREVRVPQPGLCGGGNVNLRLQFTPLKPGGVPSGSAGGCGTALFGGPAILEQVRSWRRLKPGESFRVTYARRALGGVEEAPGTYDFWGEYQPPNVTAEGMATLEHAGIEVPRVTLTSDHIRFKRRQVPE